MDFNRTKVNQVIYPSSPKSLDQMVFEISCWQVLNAQTSKTITPDKIYGIRSKDNKVIYTSSSISWPSFRSLVKLLLSYLEDNFEMCKFAKGHNPGKNLTEFPHNLISTLLIIPSQLTKFEVPISNGFRDILLTILKSRNFQRAITPEEKYLTEFVQNVVL